MNDARQAFAAHNSLSIEFPVLEGWCQREVACIECLTRAIDCRATAKLEVTLREEYRSSSD